MSCVYNNPLEEVFLQPFILTKPILTSRQPQVNCSFTPHTSNLSSKIYRLTKSLLSPQKKLLSFEILDLSSLDNEHSAIFRAHMR